MYCFKSAGAYKEVLGIYEDVKGKGAICNIYTYTEALDACINWGNWAKVAEILNDIEAAGCEPSVVTCTIVLMALSSKNCKSVEDASVLIQFFRQCDTKLTIILRYLLMETLEDDQVEALVTELGKVISFNDVKTWIMFSSGLIDALWKLSWHRRAAVVFRWTLDKGYRDLDLRNLSVGGALVAFYQWLKWLEEAANATENSDKRGGEYQLEQAAAGTAMIELPLKTLVPCGSGQRQFPSFLRFPHVVTVVTGWGRYSKVEGESLVREAVEKEIVKLDLPFRSEAHLPGRWMTDGYRLRLWLLNPDLSQKLLVSDIVTE